MKKVILARLHDFTKKSTKARLQCLLPMTRDVPDIRFRFLLAGYPEVFFCPAPVPAEMVPGTGYLYRIVLGRFRQLVDAADRHVM